MKDIMKSEDVKIEKKSNGDEIHTHPAFGCVEIHHPRGDIGPMFMTDVDHKECITLTIKTAKLNRMLNRDWVFSDQNLIEIELTHSQFVAMVTSHSGQSTPVTIRSIGIESMPGIVKQKPKIDIHKEEIRKAVEDQMSPIMNQIDELEKLANEGSISKKELKSRIFTIKCHLKNVPANAEYTMKCAVEHIEDVAAAAKVDVEAYVDSAVKRVGLESLQDMKLQIK